MWDGGGETKKIKSMFHTCNKTHKTIIFNNGHIARAFPLNPKRQKEKECHRLGSTQGSAYLLLFTLPTSPLVFLLKKVSFFSTHSIHLSS